MEGAAAGGCPICNGGKTGIVRPLDESGPPPQQQRAQQQQPPQQQRQARQGAYWPAAQAQQGAAAQGAQNQQAQRGVAPPQGQQAQPAFWQALPAQPAQAQQDGVPQGAAPRAPQAALPTQDSGVIQGWLVSVSGAGRGEYFRIVAEKNLIGGEKGGRVAVFYDQTEGEGVSGMILCDAEAGAFWLMNGCGRNLVRVNGELLLDAVRLKKGDVLKVGGTELVFAPFCGSEFRWTDPDGWI
jgi:hypothetical protein